MGKYEPISDFLREQTDGEVRLGFEGVESILGFGLPRSAVDYQAWWANDPSHSQAKAWLDAGWRTEDLDLGGRTVAFKRVGIRADLGAHPIRETPTDLWGALAGTVTILDNDALFSPSGEVWEAEA